jgi:hypothetical protein
MLETASSTSSRGGMGENRGCYIQGPPTQPVRIGCSSLAAFHLSQHSLDPVSRSCVLPTRSRQRSCQRLCNVDQTLDCALDKLLSTYKSTMMELWRLPQDPTRIVSFVSKVAQLYSYLCCANLRIVETKAPFAAIWNVFRLSADAETDRQIVARACVLVRRSELAVLPARSSSQNHPPATGFALASRSTLKAK